MNDRELARRIVEQFSGRGDRADIWRGFDAFLDTDEFLNLGYSPRYGSHLLGSPQDRLAELVVSHLRRELARAGLNSSSGLNPNSERGSSAGRGSRVGPDLECAGRLLDVGCGRGGPTYRLTGETPFDAVGIDLVGHNVELARSGAGDPTGLADDAVIDRHPSFVVGDATQLPFASGSFAGCVAVDSLVYVPAVERVFKELFRVLDCGGVGVVTDLVADQSAGVGDATIEGFCDAWDMPRLRPREQYLSRIADAGFRVRRVTDLTPHSVGRFRKWSGLYLRLADGPTRDSLSWVLRQGGLDPEAVTAQIRAAHAVLPALRHVLVTFER